MINLAGASLLFIALVFTVGCQSVEARIQKKPEVFANLDRATQNKIKRGIVENGYTEDMVYLARGEPVKKHETTGPDGVWVTWLYKSDETELAAGRFVSDYQGPAPNPYPPIPYARTDEPTEHYTFEQRSWSKTVYHPINFRDGKVHSPSY